MATEKKQSEAISKIKVEKLNFLAILYILYQISHFGLNYINEIENI